MLFLLLIEDTVGVFPRVYLGHEWDSSRSTKCVYYIVFYMFFWEMCGRVKMIQWGLF
jgi:hypothetical protein